MSPGRPRVDPSGERLVQTSVKLTNDQRIKFRRLGGSAWLRRMIEAHSGAPNGKTTPTLGPEGRG